MWLEDHLEALGMCGHQLAEEGHLAHMPQSLDLCNLQFLSQIVQLLVCQFEVVLLQISIQFHLLPQLDVIIESHAFLLQLVLEELDDQLQRTHEQLVIADLFGDIPLDDLLLLAFLHRPA